MQRINQQSVGSSTPAGQPTGHYLPELGYLLTQQVAASPSAHEQQVRVRFGQYIQSARLYHGFSRPALALRLDIKEAEVYALEAGLLPIAHIGLNLLPNLASVLDEDPALLSQLLRAGGNDGQSSLGVSSRNGWGPGFASRLRLLHQPSYTWLMACLVRIADSCLLYNHLPDLVNRLQPIRLTMYTTTVLAAIVLSFWTVHWLPAPQAAIVRTIFSESAQFLRSSHRGMDVPTSAEQRHNPAKYHTVGNEVVTALEASPQPDLSGVGSKAGIAEKYQTEQPRAENHRAENHRAEQYRIVYTPNPPVIRNAHAAYISVDDAQIAIIVSATRVPPLPDAHCSSIGRFSLCPI